MEIYGTTRSTVQFNHALITPDTHVRSPLIGWSNSEAIIHIAPVIGARFLQYTALMNVNSTSNYMTEHVERFAYVLDGQTDVVDTVGEKRCSLEPGHFAFFPAGSKLKLATIETAKIEIFEKRYVPLTGFPAPEFTSGKAAEITSEAFMGDQDAQLKTLLPKHPSFDMAVNLFTFQPGATLPLVEVHVMEHGLLLLEGAGVYRLAENYYPIKAGDVIWMASFCPQWWVAMGKTASTYLYYKDIHRDCLENVG